MSKIIDAALDYLKKGFSIIPINPRTKNPLGEWKIYQTKRASENQIKCWFKNDKFGIGIVTGNISNVAVIDADFYKDPEDLKGGKKLLESLLSDSIEVPAVQSPRGGIHNYFQCPDSKLRNDTNTIPNCDLRANGGYIIAPPTPGYKWLNNQINGNLPQLPQAYLEYIKKNKKTPFVQENSENIDYFNEGRRDEDSFTVANALINHCNLNHGFVAEVLNRIKQNWDQKEFDDKWVKSKIESALKRRDQHHDNLQEEIRNYIENTTGDFNIYDIDRELLLTTKDLKNRRRVILHRFIKELYIEKIGKRTGNYRKIIKDENIIDFRHISKQNAIDIEFVFGIHTLVNIFRKNIIIIAGEKDAGKTGFLINVIKDNMEKHNIFYFSSEMVEEELRERLDKVEEIKNIDDWKFTPIERSYDFADVIRPDDINIIDFLEITDEFYKIGEPIKKIYDKLNKGIAIIALQKKTGAEYGRGAEFSMEKARLYINLEKGHIKNGEHEPNTLKIVSAKNWKDKTKNPRGKEYKYKIINGYYFLRL